MSRRLHNPPAPGGSGALIEDDASIKASTIVTIEGMLETEDGRRILLMPLSLADLLRCAGGSQHS